MTAFLITYDLNKGDRRNYETLYTVLRTSGAVRATESSWFFASPTWTAIMIAEHLRKHLHEKDVLTVNVLAVDKGFGSNNLSAEARTWMHKYLKTQTAAVKKS